MKRLSESFDLRRQASASEWTAAVQRWTAAKIDPHDIVEILIDARTQRVMYEDYLRVLTGRPTTARTRFRQESRRFSRIVQEGRPLVRLLKQYDYIVFDLGRLVEMAIDEIGAHLAMNDPDSVRVRSADSPARPTSRLRFPPHRPGEPWLGPRVLDLWHLFRAHGYGVNATKRAIHEAFALTGHTDVVKPHKIDRIIKRTPKKQLTAARHPAHRHRKTRRSRPK